jgi:hypothetical protein
MKLKIKNWFVILSALIPAFSPGEKERCSCFFEFSHEFLRDGIGRMVSQKNFGRRWLFSLLGERARERADVQSFTQRILFAA